MSDPYNGLTDITVDEDGMFFTEAVPPLMPATIRIGGMTFSVTVEKSRFFTDAANGHVDGDKQEIHIASGIGADKARQTLLHEVFHAISFMMDGELDERQITVMANGVFAVLRDNPHLIDYLLREGE